MLYYIFLAIIFFLIIILISCKSYFNNEKELIPSTFKNKMKKFMNNNFSDIQYFNNHKIINGISMPLDIKTDHMNYELNSKHHLETLTELFYLLDIFNNFCDKYNILYTINAGNMLGYYRGCVILPWDDDIDVLVKDSDMKKIHNIWNNDNGKEYKIWWDNRFTYKKIKINSQDIFLLKLKYKNRNLFKIKLNIPKRKNKFQRDIGGLDIEGATSFCTGGMHNTSKLPKQYCDLINNSTEKDYEIIQYGPIKTKIIRKDIVLLILNKIYPRWREKIHPKLFKKNIASSILNKMYPSWKLF